MSRAKPATAIVLPALGAAAFAAVLLPCAVAQHQHRVSFVDDGNGPMVLHHTMPDFRGLREPDFVRRDLPTFEDKLALDDAQLTIAKSLLEAYLSDFTALAREKLPHGGSGFQKLEAGAAGEGGAGMSGMSGMLGMAGAHGEPGDGPAFGIGEIVADAVGGEEGDLDVAFEVGATGGQVQIFVGMSATGPEPVEGDGASDEGDAPAGAFVTAPGAVGAALAEEPGASVVIALSGPDDEPIEIPEEVRKKLEEHAKAIAEKLEEQVREAEAAGVEPGALMPPMESIEEQQRSADEMAQMAEAFEREKVLLRARFVGDLQAQLAPVQLERWPSLERTLLREKTLAQKGRLDGERTDLFEVAAKLELDAAHRAAVEEQLAAYELELDTALVERNGFIDDAQKKVDEAIQNHEPEEAIRTIDRATRLRLAVRGVNERYVETIAEKLDEEAGTTFRRDVREAFHPSIYGRSTRGTRTFEAARSIDGLDDETREAIDGLERAYISDLESANERIRLAILRYQPDEPKRMIEKLSVAMSGEGPVEFGASDDPVREAFKDRTALDERYMKQVRSLVGPDNVATLPKLPSETRNEPIIIRRTTDGTHE